MVSVRDGSEGAKTKINNFLNKLLSAARQKYCKSIFIYLNLLVNFRTLMPK